MEKEASSKSKKLSQKRTARQERKAERRRLKLEKAHFDEKKQRLTPVKVRFSSKSLPGFLAKNTDAIIKWLKDYQTLFVMADDYGIQQLDRMPEQRRRLLVQNYVDVGEFITILEDIYAQSKGDELNSSLSSETNQINKLNKSNLESN